MPRRNRQKLHHELRLKAEALKASRRDHRLAPKVGVAVAQPPVPVPPPSPEALRLRAAWSGASGLLRLAGVARDVRDRVHRLLEVVDREIPAVCAVEQLPWLLLLGGERWIRQPETFVAPAGTLAERRDALARYLLVKWPVPDFLLRALDVRPLAVARVPVEDRWAVGALAAVGRGRSLRDLVGGSTLATPLTRRMCHLFLESPADWTPIRALRTAQVVGAGGSPALATALLRTLLGVYRGDHPRVGEPFWHAVITWAAERPWVAELDPEPLAATLRWIEAEQTAAGSRGEELRLAGRTEGSVLRSVDEFLALRAAEGRARFPASGLPAWSEGAWTAVELRDPAALVEEGQQQRHCVSHYDQLAASGKVALFSLRRGGVRVATLEVVLATREIVQAKGPCNRACTPSELDAVVRFARATWLEVAPEARRAPP